MIHLFYVHSHITYIISKLIIAQNDLHEDEVVFAVARGYEINDDVIILDLNNYFNYLETKSRLEKVLGIRGAIKKIDDELQVVLSKRLFVAYLPQFNHSIFQILSSNQFCKQTVLLEEGLTSYKNDKNLYEKNRDFIKKFISFLYSKRFVPQNSHYYPFPARKFKYSICLDEECFPYYKGTKKHVLRFNRNSFAKYFNRLEDGASVFLLDAFMERTGISKSKYFDILRKTLDKKIGHNKLFLKFHPVQSEGIRNDTLVFIRENFNFKEVVLLDDKSIMEIEFLKLNNLTVIGIHSSLLFYAKKAGHTVFSGIKYTTEDTKINNYINHIMDSSQKEKFMNYV